MPQYDEIETLRAEILLGKDCNAFFNTDPGRYVIARSHEIVINGIEALKKISPGDRDAVEKIQLEIKAADNALTWLQEAITNGEQAMQQLEILADEED